MTAPSSDEPRIAEALGVILEGTRLSRDLTLTQVSARAHMDPGFVRTIEEGDSEPQITQFVELAVALGVSPVWLLEEILAWVAADQGSREDPTSLARQVLVTRIGRALIDTLESCSQREKQLAPVLGVRLVNELARWGLMVVAIPETARVNRKEGATSKRRLT
jgi:transcriptional regulator with XRE-family HTH domain